MWGKHNFLKISVIIVYFNMERCNMYQNVQFFICMEHRSYELVKMVLF